MTQRNHVARVFYALSLLAWGTQHFILGYAVAGRPLITPEDLVIGRAFTYGTGVLLIFSAIGILLNYKSRIFASATGIGILLWAGLPNIYSVVINLDYGFMLTSMNKALTMGFGGLLVAYSYDRNDTTSILARIVDVLAPYTMHIVGLFLFLSGIQHFLFADFVKFLIPTWIPGDVFLTYFAGVALMAGGLGMITGVKRKLACQLSACMIFIWVFVLHIPRALGPEGNANEWTAVFEALAVSGILYLCSRVLVPEKSSPKIAPGLEPLI